MKRTMEDFRAMKATSDKRAANEKKTDAAPEPVR
jgi:hypothetical protein